MSGESFVIGLWLGIERQRNNRLWPMLILLWSRDYLDKRRIKRISPWEPIMTFMSGAVARLVPGL